MIVDGDKRIMTADELETFIFQAKMQEREACAKFVVDTYLQDDDHEQALRARFVVKVSKSGFLEAWHQPSDIADAIRNRTNLHDDSN